MNVNRWSVFDVLYGIRVLPCFVAILGTTSRDCRVPALHVKLEPCDKYKYKYVFYSKILIKDHLQIKTTSSQILHIYIPVF